MRTIEDSAPSAHGLSDRRSSEFLGAFLYIAAHDLSRPLQMVQNTCNWLGRQTGTGCERSRVAFGERAIGELTDQLDTLVSALRLYEYTRTMAATEVALEPLLAGLSYDNDDAAARKGVRLAICPSRHRVISNPVLLKSIFGNFLSNGIKYARPGGRILVGCRKHGDDVRIDAYHSDIDTARGSLPHFVEAFQHLNSIAEDGLGLGLFAVRRAIGLLGHRIEIKSIPDRGFRFSVFAGISHAQ